MRNKLLYYISVFIFFANKNVFAVCSISGLTLPTSGSCTGCTGSATNGMNINSGGSVYCYSSSGTFASGITISNGTLRVCGNLTLASLTWSNSFSNTANIIVESGGTLTITGNVSNIPDKASIRVYGNLVLNGGMTLSGVSAGLVIENSGKVTIASSQTLNLSASNVLINRGQLYVNGTLSINTTSNMCVEESFIQVNTLDVTVMNGVTWSGAASTYSVFNVTNTMTNTAGGFTNNSAVKLCNDGCTTGCGTVGNGNTWTNPGSATKSTSACARTVPVVWGKIKADKKEGVVSFSWTTIQENNNDYFIIEESNDGENFVEKAKIKGGGNADIPLFYSTTFYSNIEGVNYFRIKQVDFNGNFEYSNVFSVSDYHSKSFLIYPNPVDKTLNQLFLENHGEEEIHISVYTSLGQIVSSGDIRVAKNEIIDIFSNLHNLVPGIYEVKLSTSSEVHVEKIEVR